MQLLTTRLIFCLLGLKIRPPQLLTLDSIFRSRWIIGPFSRLVRLSRITPPRP